MSANVFEHWRLISLIQTTTNSFAVAQVSQAAAPRASSLAQVRYRARSTQTWIYKTAERRNG
jgi:hypothetical protein